MRPVPIFKHGIAATRGRSQRSQILVPLSCLILWIGGRSIARARVILRRNDGHARPPAGLRFAPLQVVAQRGFQPRLSGGSGIALNLAGFIRHRRPVLRLALTVIAGA